MCDDSVRVIPDEQGCGERAQGGVYAECGLSKGGLPLEAFLLDPPQPLPVGVDPLTQEPMLDEAGHAIFDVLLRIGAEHSPWAADDVEETHRLGASRRLHPHPDLSRLSHSSRLLLAHPKAMLTGWRELIPPTRCRKQRPLHDQKHYDAIYRELVEAGEGIDATRDDERGGPCIFKLWEVIPREEACEVDEHEGEYPLCLRRTISLRIPWDVWASHSTINVLVSLL